MSKFVFVGYKILPANVPVNTLGVVNLVFRSHKNLSGYTATLYPLKNNSEHYTKKSFAVEEWTCHEGDVREFRFNVGAIDTQEATPCVVRLYNKKGESVCFLNRYNGVTADRALITVEDKMAIEAAKMYKKTWLDKLDDLLYG